MDAIVKFKEAALALQQDEAYLALAAAREASDADAALQEQIGEFNLVRMDLNNEMTKDNRDDARIATLNEKANGLYNTIMGNKAMVAYTEAKQGIEKMIEHVNAILNTAIEGGDPMTVEAPAPSCGHDGCSGCSGCG